MKLEKFKEKNKKKTEIVLFTITCILLISGVILYRTFAIFEANDTFNVINGTIEDPGDIYFAFYKDGVIQKEMPRKEERYVLDENQSYCGVLGKKEENIKVSLTEDWQIVVEGVTTSRTKCNLYFVKGVYILGKGIPLVESGEGLYEVTHENVASTLNNVGFGQTEYRYAGANPNNYITFNNELWRIIGLVNVMTSETDVEQRVKIVRNDSIGEYSWDTSSNNVNAGKGVNEWSQADLMKLLNPGYETNKLENENGVEQDSFANNSLYWRGESGTCYNSTSNATIECNFESKSLKNSLNIISDDIYWNTGSGDFRSNNNKENCYMMERSKNVGDICKENSFQYSECTDKVLRTYLWKGLVALVYLSDYFYSQNINNESWVTANGWTLTINQSEEVAMQVYSLVNVFNPVDVRDHLKIYPTLYLKPNVKIVSGTGSLNDAYKVVQIIK